MAKGSKVRKALAKKREAQIERQIAREYAGLGDQAGAHSYNVTADYMDKEAAALTELTEVPQVSAGEVLPDRCDNNGLSIRNTLKSPDSAAVDASIARTDLLLQDKADITALAVDAANSIDAENSLEKMLAHQMAAAHNAVMTMMDQAAGISRQMSGHDQRVCEASNIQATRLFNSANRLMKTFQQGLLTIQKIRNGGNQTVTVQHVSVSDGGQAVIGNVGGGDNQPGANLKSGNTP